MKHDMAMGCLVDMICYINKKIDVFNYLHKKEYMLQITMYEKTLR